jgi:hypothetical protein
VRIIARSCVCLVVAFPSAAIIGCKRTAGSSTSTSVTAGGSSSSGGGDHTSATGSGAVSVTGNVVTYQNVHVEVPWRNDDPVRAVRLAQDAAAGHGLKLSDGKTTLEISSDGRRLTLNGKPCGNVQEGDRVTLTADGKLLVNGGERSPQPATKTAG